MTDIVLLNISAIYFMYNVKVENKKNYIETFITFGFNIVNDT